jgi:hypothetical protein
MQGAATSSQAAAVTLRARQRDSDAEALPPPPNAPNEERSGRTFMCISRIVCYVVTLDDQRGDVKRDDAIGRDQLPDVVQQQGFQGFPTVWPQAIRASTWLRNRGLIWAVRPR